MNVKERREAQARREAAELIDEIGGPHRAATLLNVHLTTVKRWQSGEIVAQTPVLIALRFLTGRWGDENKDWEGWRLAGNILYSPGGDRFHPGDLLARRYEIQLIKYLQRQNKLLREKLSRISDGAANDAVEGEIAPPSYDYTIGRATR